MGVFARFRRRRRKILEVPNQVVFRSRHNSKLNEGQACSRYEQRAVLSPAAAWLGRHATLYIHRYRYSRSYLVLVNSKECS